MKTKVNVYQQFDEAVHRWNVYNTFTETKDKYDLYFKNRYTVKNGWEKYDNLVPLSDDYVLYKLFDKGVGAQNSTWKTNRPDLVNYNIYSEGYNDIAANNFPADDKPYIVKDWYTDGYTVSVELPSGISHGTIVKNTIGDIGVAVDADDIITIDSDSYYQKIYKEVFTGTGGIGKMVSVYPASYQSPNNTPNHWVKSSHDMAGPTDEQAAYDVRDMYNQPHLPDSAYSSTELCLYVLIDKTALAGQGQSNLDVFMTIKRNLNVNEFCVANANSEYTVDVYDSAFGFYKVQSNYYYERDTWTYFDDIYATHERGSQYHSLTPLAPWVENFLKQPNVFNLGYTSIQEGISLHGLTTTATGMVLAMANTNSNLLINDPYPLYSVDSTAQTWNWYTNLWHQQSLTITAVMDEKEYQSEWVYTDTYYNYDDWAWIKTEDNTNVIKGKDCIINTNWTSWISITGTEPYRIEPEITQRLFIDRFDDSNDMDTYGCFRLAGPTEGSYYNYTWKPFNEVNTPVGSGGGVFYSADYRLCRALFQDTERVSDWEIISNLRQQLFYDEYIRFTHASGMIVDKSSIEWQSPLTDENYTNYIATLDYGEDSLLINGLESYHFDFRYNTRENKIDIIATMLVNHKNYSSNLGQYTVIATLTSSDTLSFFNDNFYVVFGRYRYNWNTNIAQFINGLLETHTNAYPYNDSPHREVVNGKLNIAWRRADYTGFNDGYSISSTNITEPVEDFNELINGYINTDIIDIEGFEGYSAIDMESVRYGFSYPTEIYFPYRTIYDWEVSYSGLKGFRAVIDYNQLQDLFANWYDNAVWQPEKVYQLTFPPDSNPLDGVRTATYEYVSPTHTQYNWHPMGIKPNRYWLKEEDNKVSLQLNYIEDNKQDYLYEIIFELTEPVAANTFYLLDAERIKTNLMATFEIPDPEEIYEINEIYNVVKPSSRLIAWRYTTLSEYLNSTEERWLTQLVYQFPQGAYVPTQHWPEMLYEKDRYNDVDVIVSTEMDYPNMGYYPPKEEMLPDNFKTELEEGQAIYRYIGDINEYYSTVKAGSIYLPVGADIEELLLTPYDENSENNNIETNPYGYEYIGEEEVVNKNALMRVATSTDFGAYPKDGLASDGFWYEYIGTNEEVEYIWTENELRSNANFNIDVNSNQDFTIGDVAGASFRVDIQGNIRDTIQYLGRKVRLFYDFENKDEYKDFGLFTIDDVKFMNHQVSSITAYDNIKKFDAPVYEYLTSDNVKPLYPMTAKTLFQLMCEYCEVPYYTSMEFLNSNTLCYGPFGDANLTARQVLSYVAELAAGYIVCDNNGFAVIKTMKPYINLVSQEDSTEIVNQYTTDYENIIPLLNSANLNKAEINRTLYPIKKQVNQKMDIFPTEVIDSIVFNNADTDSFINYRKELNAIYDLSDNPFLAFVDNQIDADEITNGILDQIAILIPPLYNEDPKFYSGEIELKNFDYSTFGTKQVVMLLDEIKERDYFIPTTISINETGITLSAKGQPKYSTKIVNSELAKQVNSLKMNIKEIKLTIPDALADTLDNHGQQISTIETDLGAVQESVSSLDTALETQRTETSTQFTNVNRRDDGQDDRLDGHDTDIAALQAKDTTIEGSISTLSSTVGTNTSNISSLQTTVNGLPTKTYVDNLNQVNSITHGWKLSIGEDEVSFYTDNGYLFISDGTTTWKLKLEVNA